MEEAPLGGLSPKVFLRRHWQKRPLLVRGALPGFRGVIGRSALFALAARDEVESRLVERRKDRTGRGGNLWAVMHGPLSKSRLMKAGERNWTLLVNGVNCHSEAAERLLRRFAFVPQARLDDLMVSYAVPGGGVGPHVDSYDVFLIQGEGRRLWRIARPKRFDFVPHAPLKLIQGFEPENEWLLETGDLLYLPPGWGHDGVALDACVTCSVGFRAPRGAELAAAFLDYLQERGLPDAAYRDPGLRATRNPARISGRMSTFTNAVLNRIRWQRRDATELLGRFLTTPKNNIVFRKSPRPARLNGRVAVLDARTQLLYAGRRFFINGETLVPRAGQRRALARLADRRSAPGRLLARAGLGPLISDWQRAGYLRLEPSS